MKAVMARILGRAGSGGALRWAWPAGEVRTKTEQSKTQKRSVPRRIGYLQTGRSNAAPLQDTGFGCGSGAELEKLVQTSAACRAATKRKTKRRRRCRLCARRLRACGC